MKLTQEIATVPWPFRLGKSRGHPGSRYGHDEMMGKQQVIEAIFLVLTMVETKVLFQKYTGKHTSKNVGIAISMTPNCVVFVFFWLDQTTRNTRPNSILLKNKIHLQHGENVNISFPPYFFGFPLRMLCGFSSSRRNAHCSVHHSKVQVEKISRITSQGSKRRIFPLNIQG